MNRIPKPQGTHWTDDQWNAVSLQGDDILVAAAAGSGKTAVLVERIIRRISSEENPLDVDRLLVATFTNAAAAEMRQRIREALEQELSRKPDSVHLRKQLALLHQASITTLHAFCLDVVRRYFHLIDLDPGFRIANETEAELMRQEVLEDLLEDYYAKGDDDADFWRLVDRFSGERTDEALFHMIQSIYDFSRSHPSPVHWMHQAAEAFAVTGENNIWLESMRDDVEIELTGAIRLLQEAERVCRLPGGPSPYLDNLREDLSGLKRLLEAALNDTWKDIYEAFQACGFGKLKPCRGDACDKALQDQVKELRDQTKKRVEGLKETIFRRSPEEYAAELHELAPLMKKLVELVEGFGHKYAAAKKAKGLADFSDLEHYCLQVLRDPSAAADEPEPSQAALEYREQFAEVLVDEYQDTNMVQEAIVRLISGEGPGNRFMVGDVKQSIYRFRLAEPALFLQKYKSYRQISVIPNEFGGAGLRIDLSKNFRSRREIVDAVNFIFRQIMHERAAEIDYDRDAELVCGADFPEGGDASVEVMLIDRSEADAEESDRLEDFASSGTSADGEADEPVDGDALDDVQDMMTAQLEARLIAERIRRLTGIGASPHYITDKQTKLMRPVVFRDIVILLRATQQWAPVFMEEFRAAGIPAYAELSTGYFAAAEVDVVLSLLKVIDNPLQDIPLAGVLRSPIFRLSAEELAQIRLYNKRSSYYEALSGYAGCEQPSDPQLQTKLRLFLQQLERWRDEARQGALADLIWRVYRETGYFDLVGGQPGGMQRQANLRALYDRARQFEATSLRGLFRFLRFIERMRDSGGDLGAARALGEQEDVVRIMSIHKSKGLEFPVVFVAGLAKPFNRQDLNGSFLMHKQLGFGPKYVDPQLRISYPTLPLLAIRRRMRMETLAEEMRILYVALTRAKEKLLLVGTVRNLETLTQRWGKLLEQQERALPAHILTRAVNYLDWIGPAIVRHPGMAQLRSIAGTPERIPEEMKGESSDWRLQLIRPEHFLAFDQTAGAANVFDPQEWEKLRRLEPISAAQAGFAVQSGSAAHPAGPNSAAEEIGRRFSWAYPYREAQLRFSKTSVSEMKRLSEIRLMRDLQGDHADLSGDLPFKPGTGSLALQRPRFMELRRMTPAERGTVYHSVMQQIPLVPDLSEEMIEQTLVRMVELQILTEEQKQAVDAKIIISFFQSGLGQRMLRSGRVRREVPFSFAMKAGEVYPGMDPHSSEETVVIQGVIDCLFEEEEHMVLLDFKTDAVNGSSGELGIERLADRYRLQIDLYARAVERILNKPVKEKYLFFFDGSHTVHM
ncbi:helicase-exonuclease AddAB subunit AddA [Ferviditalea candida]|uniref:ATP-dependent helicase/nuclease subunit A n=1 Tax=Ferviditalea candida TaxID=3108399 RepID=A0ABU5ZG81_9BACL|nr:helicase-exonuclease AddAB subunit AddA [Paenibacillaceae bacterium T2]